MGVARYIMTFGIIDEKHHGWGQNVWSGLISMLHAYPHKYKLGPQLVGWFALPTPFSKGQAEHHVCEDRMQHDYYPAIFSEDTPDAICVRMACLNIIIEGSKIWWVHRSRMVNWRPIADVTRALPPPKGP